MLKLLLIFKFPADLPVLYVSYGIPALRGSHDQAGIAYILQLQAPVRIFCLTAVCVDHDIFISDFFDDLKVIRQIALICSASHVLGITALQDHIVVLTMRI